MVILHDHSVRSAVPVSPEHKALVLEALRAARPIEVKAMFGGLGIYLDGVFMAVVDDDRP